MAAGLERSGADFVVMACNTAHAYEAEIRAALGVPFVSLIAETAAVLRGRYPEAKRVGLRAASGCIDAFLYQDALARGDVESLILDADGQRRFMTLLYEIKRGNLSDAARTEMRTLANLLIAAGAAVVIAGCTEIPLLLAQPDITTPLLDTTAVLVERTLAYARDGEAFPP
jgi:aspartate racemase